MGLSLSYDIIKVYGGDLKVETKEGKGAEFTIVLPDEAKYEYNYVFFATHPTAELF